MEAQHFGIREFGLLLFILMWWNVAFFREQNNNDVGNDTDEEGKVSYPKHNLRAKRISRKRKRARKRILMPWRACLRRWIFPVFRESEFQYRVIKRFYLMSPELRDSILMHFVRGAVPDWHFHCPESLVCLLTLVVPMACEYSTWQSLWLVNTQPKENSPSFCLPLWGFQFPCMLQIL